MKNKKMTIRDIAKLAGVSHMTVSRVLNNDKMVRSETRERVLAVVQKYNFVPNAKARALSSNKSRIIGLLVSDISNPFYAELARGMEKQAYELGYNIMFCSEVTLKKGHDALKFLLQAGVDGIVFASSKLKEPHIRKLLSDGFPTVLVNRKLEGDDFDHVVCDNLKGSELMMNHLFDLGYEKIAIITGSSDLSTGVERLEGYRSSCINAGIAINEDYVFEGPFDKNTGYSGARHFINLDDPPQAIFAGNDYIAMGVFNALDEAGLRIPEDIAVVGFDNTDFAAHSRINLTTVSQQKFAMGTLGVKILIESIELKNNDYKHKIVLDPKLIIRESCGRWNSKKF
jgi:LacI family transcriptional regulator